MSAKYLYCVGTASAVLGTAYLSGGVGLALQHGNHREEADTLMELPQEFTLFITPQKKQVAPELPTASEPAPSPEHLPVAAAPPPAPAPEILQESPKPKPAPVVSAQKSSFALKRPTHHKEEQPTTRRKPPRALSATGHPKENPPAAKAAATSGTVAAGRLDELPRLLNSPSVAFPASIRRKGITQGRAVLEVEIDIRGRVTVKRILEISDAALESTARNFAAAARFSTPRRGGQPVRTVFRWPLTLRP